MNLQEQLALSDEHYGLLFDVRRSVRYHDRRRAFYERMHHVTSLLTILMAGSVLFDLAKPGATASWMMGLSVIAALMATADMVFSYSTRANLHSGLRARFADLEIAMLTGGSTAEEWSDYQRTRLLIEKDEPVVYKVLDLLCRNELLIAEGFTLKDHKEQFANVSGWQKLTSQFWRWDSWSMT